MTVKDILRKWDTRADLARDLDVAPFIVQAWWRRESIPGEHWLAVVAAAHQRGLGDVTLEALAQAHAKSPVACCGS